MINKTITQRLNELELNENRLQAPCRANTKAVLTGVEVKRGFYE